MMLIRARAEKNKQTKKQQWTFPVTNSYGNHVKPFFFFVYFLLHPFLKASQASSMDKYAVDISRVFTH